MMIRAALLFASFNLSLLANSQVFKKLADKAKAKIEEGVNTVKKLAAENQSKKDSVELDTKRRPSNDPGIGGEKEVPGESRKQVLQLQPGEYLVAGEARLVIKFDSEEVRLITNEKNKFYFYENANRSGPFSKPPVSMLGQWPVEYVGRQNIGLSDFSAYTTGPMYRTSLVINGNKYGPFLFIQDFYIAEDKKLFYAQVSASDSKKDAFFFLSNNRKTALPGPGTGLMVSDNNQFAALSYTTTQLRAKDNSYVVRDLSGDSVYLVFADGKKKGPFPDYNYCEKWISNKGQLMQVKTNNSKQLFIDGRPGPVFGTNISNRGGLLLNDDATSGAYYDDYGSLYFSDGSMIRNSINPQVVKKSGQTFLYWLSFDHTGKIYVCNKVI